MITMLVEKLSRAIARYLSMPLRGYIPTPVTPIKLLEDTLRPGDVLLVEGNQRISNAIRYLTQSTWSHATLCVAAKTESQPCTLIEADLEHGVVTVPLQNYAIYHTRICRPVGLDQSDIDALITFVMQRVGLSYDLKNVFDLLRYLLPLPIPVRFRRRMLALGSGDPTRVICSTLIAQAFQSIQYPILPHADDESSENKDAPRFLRPRHHSLFTPRDFDVSPYFSVVKPSIEHNFQFHNLQWAQQRQQSH